MLWTLRITCAWLFVLSACGLACAGDPPPPRDAKGRVILASEDGPSLEEQQEAQEGPYDQETQDERRKRKQEEARRQPVLVTRGDDARVGAEVSKQVEAAMGVVEDEALTAYVQELGTRLARAVPRYSGYQFKIVDDMTPNAFALPGGYIYVSRGLLALAESEDELANVIGHEITHAVRRHTARQQAIAAAQPLLAMPWVKAGKLAGYNRDMEREADKYGQQIAAAAGYDPAAMASFMAKLGTSDRLKRGFSRIPSFFDTHPGTQERVAINATRAREIRWKRKPELGDTHRGYLKQIDGLPIAERPDAGFFQGRLFIHPTLDFQLLFPSGWETQNTGAAVGAKEPSGDAVIYLEGGPKSDSLEDAVQLVLDEAPVGTTTIASQPLFLGGFEAWRLELSIPAAPGNRVIGLVTIIDGGDVTWRINGLALRTAAKRFRGRMLATPRSFRKLSPEQKTGIRITRLRLDEARSGERLSDLSRRVGNEWTLPDTAVLNALQGDYRFDGGELVKFAREEPWSPSR